MAYYVGDVAVLTASFADSSGTPTDPTDVVFEVRDPDDTITSPTPTHVSTGVYTYDLPLPTAGVWTWTATGTGAVEAAGPDAFRVQPLPF